MRRFCCGFSFERHTHIPWKVVARTYVPRLFSTVHYVTAFGRRGQLLCLVCVCARAPECVCVRMCATLCQREIVFLRFLRMIFQWFPYPRYLIEMWLVCTSYFAWDCNFKPESFRTFHLNYHPPVPWDAQFLASKSQRVSGHKPAVKFPLIPLHWNESRPEGQYLTEICMCGWGHIPVGATLIWHLLPAAGEGPEKRQLAKRNVLALTIT